MNGKPIVLPLDTGFNHTILSGSGALGYAAKAFWTSRRNWRLWAIIATLFLLYTAITLPILSKMQKAPLLLMGPLGNVELLLAILLLGWLVPDRSGNR